MDSEGPEASRKEPGCEAEARPVRVHDDGLSLEPPSCNPHQTQGPERRVEQLAGLRLARAGLPKHEPRGVRQHRSPEPVRPEGSHKPGKVFRYATDDRPIHVRDEDDSGLGGQHSPSTRGPPSRIGFQEVIEESCKGDHLVLSGTCAEQLLQIAEVRSAPETHPTRERGTHGIVDCLPGVDEERDLGGGGCLDGIESPPDPHGMEISQAKGRSANIGVRGHGNLDERHSPDRGGSGSRNAIGRAGTPSKIDPGSAPRLPNPATGDDG